MTHILCTHNQTRSIHHPDCQHNRTKATNICQLCQNQGQYDYQCQFAGDFMARTQKAFNQGHSYNHQESNQNDWSNAENDNNDPNTQPFQ